MRYRLPLWGTAIAVAAAVLITFCATYIFAERKFQRTLDAMSVSGASVSESTAEPQDDEPTSAQLTAEGVGMYLTRESGVYSVDGVIEGEAAAVSGFMAGDIITEVNGTPPTTASIEALGAGDTVALTRDGEALTLTISSKQ